MHPPSCRPVKQAQSGSRSTFGPQPEAPRWALGDPAARHLAEPCRHRAPRHSTCCPGSARGCDPQSLLVATAGAVRAPVGPPGCFKEEQPHGEHNSTKCPRSPGTELSVSTALFASVQNRASVSPERCTEGEGRWQQH